MSDEREKDMAAAAVHRDRIRPVARSGQLALAGNLGLAIILAVLERVLPIRPHFVILEVVAGAAICLLSAARTLRRAEGAGIKISAAEYEAMVWAAFVGGGVVMAIWQFLEYGLQLRMRYPG